MNARRLECFFACAMLIACAAGGDDPGGGRRSSRTRGAVAAGADGAAGAGDFGNQSMGGPVPPGPAGPGPLAPQGERQLVVKDECAGALAPEVLTALADPNAPTGSRFVYPYERTVFPRGLSAPVLQWDAPAGGATSVRIRLTSMLLDYTVCLPLTEPMRVAVPDAAWELAGAQSLGKGDPLTVEATLHGSGGAVRLPALTLVFALADLKGAVYYNTYGSLIANHMGIVGGVVMRVLPGQPAPEVFLSAPNPVVNCVGCHAVSADGSRMVAEIHGQPGLFEGPSSSFDLAAAGPGTNPPPLAQTLRRAGFAALYPDGSIYLTTGRIGPGPIGAGLGAPAGNIPGTFGPEESKLYDTASGVEIPGSGIEPFAYMPTFSVDGTMLVYNRMDASGTSGHALAVMDFDRGANKFSNPRTVFNEPARFPAWPFFVPDVVETATLDGRDVPRARGKRVVFALGQMPDFTTQEQPLGLSPHVSDLWWVDVDAGVAAPLDRANGAEAGTLYLPYGERDAHKNYIPTVSPVAAGGYFWLFFTSKRNYGNLFIADPPETRAEAKKIWVSAIDIDAPPGTDPSHPAFFLPGQEIESGNIRAFATLEPCRDNGTACETGIDCCCGYCREGQCGCADTCANIDEKCETAADCCSKSARCIGGYCAYVVE